MTAAHNEYEPPPEYLGPPIPDRGDTRWMRQAACAGMPIKVFFPPAGPGASKKALQVCQDCPVRVPCAQDALDMGDMHGVRGGVHIVRNNGRGPAVAALRRAAHPNTTDIQGAAS